MSILDAQLAAYDDVVNAYLVIVQGIEANGHASRGLWIALIQAGADAADVGVNCEKSPDIALARVRHLLELEVAVKLMSHNPDIEQRWRDLGEVKAELCNELGRDWASLYPLYEATQKRLGFGYPPCFYQENGWAQPVDGHDSANCGHKWTDPANATKRPIDFRRLMKHAGLEGQYDIYAAASEHAVHARPIIAGLASRGLTLRQAVPAGIAGIILNNFVGYLSDPFKADVTLGDMAEFDKALRRMESAIPDVVGI